MYYATGMDNVYWPASGSHYPMLVGADYSQATGGTSYSRTSIEYDEVNNGLVVHPTGTQRPAMWNFNAQLGLCRQNQCSFTDAQGIVGPADPKYSYRMTLVENYDTDGFGSTNFGNVCGGPLAQFGWTQSACPVLPVATSAGSAWLNDASVKFYMPANLSNFIYVKSVSIWANKDQGIAQASLQYSDPSVSIVTDENILLTGFTKTTCNLADDENIVGMKILAQNSGSLASRAVAGIWWVTNKDNYCSTPFAANDPIWATATNVEVGSGTPIGIATSLATSTTAGSTKDAFGGFGLVFYQPVVAGESAPIWSVPAAQSALKTNPTQIATTVCSNPINSQTSPTCTLQFTISKQDTQQFTKAYSSTDTYSDSSALKIAEKIGVAFSAKFAVGELFASAETTTTVSVDWTFER